MLIILYAVNETFHRNVQVLRRPVLFFDTGFILGREEFGGSCTWAYGFEQKTMY